MKKVVLILIILAGCFPAILAIVKYFENEKKEGQAKINEAELKAKVDSLNLANSQLSKQLSALSNDNIKNKKEADQAQLELKNLQMKNLQNLSDLSHAYQQNASLERERGKYLTGGDAIPLVTATVRFYSMDPYRKYNGDKIEEYINKWICEFKVQNSGIFPLTNIRSYRITQGSAINKNVQQFQPIDMLGGKETKEFQPTEVFKNPSSAYRTFEIKVEW